MDTVIKFSVPTLYDALQNGYEFTGKTKLVKKAVVEETYVEGQEEPVITVLEPAKYRYACEGCGCMCSPQELVDTSPYDGIPNDWACGGCREKQMRANAKVQQALVHKPTHEEFTVNEVFDAEGFRLADEAYYKEMHRVRCECQREFAKGLLQAHQAPPELLATVGIIDKDINNRKMPFVAKVNTAVDTQSTTMAITVVENGAGAAPGQAVTIGNEAAVVVGATGNEIVVERQNPAEHAPGTAVVVDETGT